jgi:GT2 family glycosyltransferase
MEVRTVLLVNSDIVMSPDCLERLEAALCQQPGGDIAGPIVLSRVHPDRIASAGLRYNRRTGRIRVMGVGALAAGASSTWHGVDAVSGCLMLVKREVFETIGLLDERYFFGFEDLDFCLRAKDAGFSTCSRVVRRLIMRVAARSARPRRAGSISVRAITCSSRASACRGNAPEPGCVAFCGSRRSTWLTP